MTKRTVGATQLRSRIEIGAMARSLYIRSLYIERDAVPDALQSMTGSTSAASTRELE